MYFDDRFTAPADRGSGGAPDHRRARLVATFSGLAVLGLALGVGTAELAGTRVITGGGQDPLRPVAVTTVTREPVVPSQERAESDRADRDDRATDEAEDDVEPPATPTAGRTPNYRSIPADAATEAGLDFGYLTEVTSQDGTLVLHFDRASFHAGEAATARNGGTAPDDGYLIENTNPAVRTFPLDPQASIIAVSRLVGAGQVSREGLTAAEFLANTRAALAQGPAGGIPVWLRHTDGLAGPVTALSEQYLP